MTLSITAQAQLWSSSYSGRSHFIYCYAVLLCWMSLCWVSLCQMSLCWKSWCHCIVLAG